MSNNWGYWTPRGSPFPKDLSRNESHHHPNFPSSKIGLCKLQNRISARWIIKPDSYTSKIFVAQVSPLHSPWPHNPSWVSNFQHHFTNKLILRFLKYLNPRPPFFFDLQILSTWTYGNFSFISFSAKRISYDVYPSMKFLFSPEEAAYASNFLIIFHTKEVPVRILKRRGWNPNTQILHG
jgi:hypothetical protein